MNKTSAKTARDILAGYWLVVSLLYLLLILIKTPQFGEDAGKVFIQAPAIVTPVLALVLTYLFGGKVGKEPLQNTAAFYAALFISVVHTAAIVVVLFVWNADGKTTMTQSLARAAEFMPYFSTVTIASLNYCLLGMTVQEKQLRELNDKPNPKKKPSK